MLSEGYKGMANVDGMSRGGFLIGDGEHGRFCFTSWKLVCPGKKKLYYNLFCLQDMMCAKCTCIEVKKMKSTDMYYFWILPSAYLHTGQNPLIKNIGFRTEYKLYHTKSFFTLTETHMDWWLTSCWKIKQCEKLTVNISQLHQCLKRNVSLETFWKY